MIRTNASHIRFAFGLIAQLALCTTISSTAAEAEHHAEGQNTPLLMAAFAGDLATVKALVAKGANVNEANVYGNMPLHFALRRTVAGRRQDRVNIVTFLVEHGANVDSKTNTDRTPLMDAADIGDTPAVKYLLEHHAKADLADNKGNTALSIATYHVYPDIVTLIVGQVANVDVPDQSGQTPLFKTINGVSAQLHHNATSTNGAGNADAALKHDAYTIADTLLSHGAKVNVADKDGWTPLAMAAYIPDPALTSLLVKHGADVNVHVANMGGETPVMIAISRNSNDTLAALLSAKPDLSQKDAAGRTAMGWAIAYKDDEMAVMLAKSGALR